MRDEDLRRDGNAAAGLLTEVFTAEATAAVATCAACGRTGAIGAAHAYDQGPGTVLRCAGCSSVLLRIARAGDRMVADFRGMATLAYRPGA